MLNTALIHYIRNTLNQGYDRNTVYSYLLALGWNAGDIQDSLYFVEQEIKARRMRMQQPQPRMRHMQQTPIMQRQMMQQQFYRPENEAPAASFVIPIIGIFLVLIVSGGIFLFVNSEKTTVGVPTGVTEENVKPAEQTVLSCSYCQYIKDGKCVDYVCCSDNDCNDNNPGTIDICNYPVSVNSECANSPIERPPAQEAAPNTNQNASQIEQQEPLIAKLDSCLDQFGIECFEGERCPGEILPAIDTDKCCSVMCE